MSTIAFPIMYINDPEKGRPIFNGQMYFGQPDLDPEIFTNQKQVYYIQENGDLVAASQPILLSAGGNPTYNGDAVTLSITGEYSTKVLDKLGAQEYYIARTDSSGTSGSVITYAEDSQTLVAGQLVVNFSGITTAVANIYIGKNSGDRGKLFKDDDYTVTGSSQITLLTSFNAGTKLIAASSELAPRVDTIKPMTLAEAVSNTTALDGQIVQVTDRADGQFQYLTGQTPNGANIVAADKATLDLVLRTKSTIIAEQWGIFGNNASSPYSSSFLAFMDFTANDSVTEARFPNVEITFDNSTPASFQSNCTYTGGRSTVIKPTVFNQRVFLTTGKTNFEIRKLTSFINEGAGGENNWIGGGYWRFETCTKFKMFSPNVSKSFGTGIKFVDCSDFEIFRPRCRYNQFSGLELEGCSDYLVKDYKLNKNGRYSSNDGFKPLPLLWAGTHGGRGIVISGNGDNVDQGNSLIKNGQVKENSEYGLRCFASSTKGIKNLRITELVAQDNGAPAGTYGTIVLASAKGTDVLVNSDVSGESERININDTIINRSLAYGTPISIDGEQHTCDGVEVRCNGAASNVIAAFSLFGAKNYTQKNCKSFDANQHIVFGGNSPTDVDISDDRAIRCLKYQQSAPLGDSNSFRGIRAKHSDTTAIVDENGVDIIANGEYKDVVFDGFYRGVTYTGAGVIRLEQVITKNTVDVGFRNFTNTSSTLIVTSCDFDSVNPFDATIKVHDGSGVRQSSISYNAGIPATGYFKAGSTVYDVTPDAVASNRVKIGWYRLTTGTGHVLNTDWSEMWVAIQSAP